MKNPIVQGWYADPESRVYDGKVYLYVTRSLTFEEQTNLDVVVSEDLENFKIDNSKTVILSVDSNFIISTYESL